MPKIKNYPNAQYKNAHLDNLNAHLNNHIKDMKSYIKHG